MMEKGRKLEKFFISLWVSVGKIIGLFFVDINDTGRFYCIKYLDYFSVFVGLFVVFLYPFAYLYMIKAINIFEEFDISLSINVSKIRDLLSYIFIIIAFLFQNYNRENLRDFLNEFLDFQTYFKNEFKSNYSEDFQRSYRNMSISITIKFILVILRIFIWFSVVDLSKFDLYYFIVIMLPELGILVVGNQYFAGILMLQYSIGNVKNVILHLNKKSKFGENFKFIEKLMQLESDLLLSDEIEKLSIIHNKLFELYRKLSGMYQLQMLLIVVSSFIGFMLDCFYVYIISLFNYWDLLLEKCAMLQIASWLSVILRIFDIYFHLSLSFETSCADERNLGIISEMTFIYKDPRLKRSVRNNFL